MNDSVAIVVARGLAMGQCQERNLCGNLMLQNYSLPNVEKREVVSLLWTTLTGKWALSGEKECRSELGILLEFPALPRSLLKMLYSIFRWKGH